MAPLTGQAKQHKTRDKAYQHQIIQTGHKSLPIEPTFSCFDYSFFWSRAKADKKVSAETKWVIPLGRKEAVPPEWIRAGIMV